MINCFLVGLNLSSDINQLLLVHLNEFEVFLGDVVIVLFHLLERLLVIFHQVINVLVFAFLDFVNLDLHPQFKLFLQVFKLVLVVFNQLFFGCLE